VNCILMVLLVVGEFGRWSLDSSVEEVMDAVGDVVLSEENVYVIYAKP
jgi:hypothetical protein